MSRFTVIVGQYSLVNQDEGEQVFPIREILKNPQYDSETNKNDLALIQVLLMFNELSIEIIQHYSLI